MHTAEPYPSVRSILLLLAALLMCPLQAWAQAPAGPATLKVVLMKATTASDYQVEQYNDVDAIPSNEALVRAPKSLANESLKAIGAGGDWWYAITRSGTANCFYQYASYENLRDGKGFRKTCNTGVDGYRGLTSDGRLFYTLYWDGARHWWQSYLTWNDVISNAPYSRQTSQRHGDIYKGIVFDPVQRTFMSLAQSGTNVWILKYANYTDMVTVNSLPGSQVFQSHERFAGMGIGPVDPTLDVYVMAGQSNAVGWQADGAALVPSSADAQIRFFYSIGNGMDPNPATPAAVTTLRPQPALFRASPPTTFGIEMGAARTLYDAGRRNMAVLKVAYGGTDLAAQWHPTNSTGLFKRLQDDLSKASRQWNNAGYRTRIAGFFWMQGEFDALDPAKASAYQGNLTQLLALVRASANDTCLPVVIGRIRKDPWAHSEAVRSAQEQVAANDPKCSKWVNTDDLPLHQDGTHFTSAGQAELGNRMGKAYLDIAGR